LVLLAGFAGQVAAAGAESVPREYQLFDNPVVARGRGFELRQSDLDQAVVGLNATLATQGQRVPEGRRAEVEERVLDRMILTRILQEKATNEDRRQAKETADRFIAQTKERTTSEASYRRQLIAVGITPELFERRALEQAIVETVINRELRDTLTIPEAQLRQFYEQGADLRTQELAAERERLRQQGKEREAAYTDLGKQIEDIKQANQARLNRPDLVRAGLIVAYTRDIITRLELPADVRTVKRRNIEQALARVKGGEDFATVAKEVSDDPNARFTGGEFGGSRESVPLPELRDVLFRLPVNEISGVIETSVGYYIAKVYERNAAGRVPYLEARSDIREFLLAQELQQRLPEYFEKLKQEYGVEILWQPPEN
jgi:parvulin-like peptidyl-prolyl isomerase